MVLWCELKILLLGITVRHHSASLVMPNSYPCGGIFNPHLTTIKDSYHKKPSRKNTVICLVFSFLHVCFGLLLYLLISIFCFDLQVLPLLSKRKEIQKSLLTTLLKRWHLVHQMKILGLRNRQNFRMYTVLSVLTSFKVRRGWQNICETAMTLVTCTSVRYVRLFVGLISRSYSTWKSIRVSRRTRGPIAVNKHQRK